MLKGENVTLRPVREADLDRCARWTSISKAAATTGRARSCLKRLYRREFQETGFWGENFGRLLMEDESGDVIGEILYFKTVQYWMNSRSGIACSASIIGARARRPKRWDS